VVEHDHPKSLASARWLFPLYMLLINIFVVPIALAGLALLGPGHNPDLFVLALPLLGGSDWLSIFVFIGGLSAGDQHGGGRLHGASPAWSATSS
jgi:Na+/proline symporter